MTTQERLAGRRHRISRIRRSTIGGAIATFAVAWAIIFFQLVSGHDPALGNTAGDSASTANSSSSSASTSSGDQYSYPEEDDYYSQNTAPAQTSHAPLDSVTTQQS